MRRTLGFCIASLALAACAGETTAPRCDGPTTAIADIQGRASASPLEGAPVTVEGVVTATFPGSEAWNGFFVQAVAPDAEASTSDGLFVHAADRAARVGQTLRVSGTVVEHDGMTTIEKVTTIGTCGEAVAVPARLAADDASRLEPYEGMLVELEGPLTVADTWELGEKGRWLVVPGGRWITSTNGTDPAPGPREALVIDDGWTIEPAPAIPRVAGGRPMRVGDRLGRLRAVVTESEDGYALQPVEDLAFSAVAQRPASPPAVGGGLRVAAMNVLNYFTTFEVRGADSETELDRQQAKIVAALSALDADILGLVEVENGGPALARLTDALNAAHGTSYRAAGAPDQAVGGDQIRVALLYRADRLEAVGTQQVYADPVYRDRPPVAQTFRFGSETFSVMVAHLKSKGGCGNATGPDRDQGDGQGCWNDLRVREARRLLDLVAELQRSSGDADVLLTGDFNAYGAEDPVLALRRGGLVDLTERFVDPAERYSFVYRGRTGSLDYMFATAAIAVRATGAAYWHINADEARALDYRAENPDGLYRPDPFRSSDHDPVLVGLFEP